MGQRQSRTPSAPFFTFYFLLFTFYLSACSWAPEPSSENPPVSSPIVTIVFRHSRVSGPESYFKHLVAGFSRSHPEIHVLDQTLPWDTGRQRQIYTINLRAQSDTVDVLAMDIIWIPEFARNGWVRDLSSEFTESARTDYLPQTIQAAIYRGKIYAVPWFTDAGLLYYRKDLLEKHGYPGPPQTWVELVRMSRRILEREGNPSLTGFLWQGKPYEGLVCVGMEFLESAGAQAVDRHGRWRLRVKKAEQALRLMRDLLYRHRVTPLLVLSADEEATRQVFENGQGVFLRNWPYAYVLFGKADSPVRDKFGIAPLPGFRRGRSSGTLGGWFLGINRYSKHPRESFEFIRYLTSKEVQRALFERVGYLPTRTVLYRDPRLSWEHPYLSDLERILREARSRPMIPSYPQLSELLQSELSAVLSQSKTPRQAVREINRRAEEIQRARPY